ncbi:MAG TPA: LamG-like jellyroll fold domain-containing protein [Flavipsychrobacter sp.]|nr:LamG-like jellyroll fold domain-containing protein [Flavipsychrobacter sp.]
MRKSILLVSALAILFSADAQVNLNNGLKVYLPLNNSVQDLSGNDNHGINHGGVTFGSDDFGNPNSAAFFDGINDWIEVPDSNDITMGHAATVAFKFKTNSASMQDIINKATYAGNPIIQFEVEVFAASWHPSNNLLFGTKHNNDCQPVGLLPNYVYSDSITQLNTWYCVLLTFDNGIKRMYVNGILTGQDTVSGTSNDSMIDSCVSPLKLGVWWSGALNHFSGYIDEVRLYDRVLNTQELDSVCNYNSQLTLSLNTTTKHENVFEVYPNPVEGNNLHLSMQGNTNDITVSVTDHLGQLVLRRELSLNKTLNISSLPPGNYLAELKTSRGRYYQKFTRL